MTARIGENQIVALEKRFWEAMKAGDHETAMRLTDETCIVTGAQGAGKIPRTALGEMLRTATYRIIDFELRDVQTLVPSDDVAIVAYKVRESLEVEGKPLTLEAYDSSTWVHKNGQWLCALHTESLAGDPFGRDRGLQA